MGNPSAAIAALEALGPRMEALLAATDVQASGVLTAQDFAFWAALSTEIEQDVGVYVATLDATAEALVARLRVLVETGVADGEGKGSGVLRIAVATFQGLKIAKRWDVLHVASLALLDVVAAAIQQRLEDDDGEVLLTLTGMYEAILLGFQHTGELIVRAAPQIATLAPLIAGVGHEALTRQFVVTALALVQSQRVYEVEGGVIRQSLEDAFTPEFTRRSIAECEAALRTAAWIVPSETLNKYLSTVEGKWVQDEFSSEQRASAASAPQNAGSITLRKAANVLAYDFRAMIDDSKTKTQLQLDGALFRPLVGDGQVESRGSWQLEGHWSQVVSPVAVNGAVQVAAPTIQSQPWNCPACTLSNEGSASKCATCGAEAPKDTSSQTTKAGAKTTNPAPFQAVFDADHTVMRVRWSRGEQSGVWLARKQESSLAFNLCESLREASSSAMSDSDAIPSYAFSSRGEPARVLLLEKSYTLSTYGEMAVELWIQVEAVPSTPSNQTILATGEFELCIEPSTGKLVWSIGAGSDVITASASVADGQYHHISLLFTKQYSQILVDGIVAGQSALCVSDRASIVSSRSAWLSIGGRLSDDGKTVDACFRGVVLELRVWSDVSSRSLFSPADALSGSEAGLIGYHPLVGDSHRILLDASKHGNHAIPFGCIQADQDGKVAGAEIGALFSPSTAVGATPVTKHFTSVVGNFEFSGVAVHNEVRGAPGLRMNHPSAVWHSPPVSVTEDFRSVVTVDMPELTSSHSSQLVFALSESSFWEASTMISEVVSLGLPFDEELSQHRFGGSALLVVLEHEAMENSSGRGASVAVYVWKNRRPLQLCRVAKLPVVPQAQPGLVVTYSKSSHALEIEVLGSGATVEVAVDIEAALGLSSSRLRTGIVLSSSLLQTDASSLPSQCSSTITSWTFESVEGRDCNVSAIDMIYPQLKGKMSDDGSSSPGKRNASSGPTVACTRTTSDGSAIEQPTYGCQTCDVVHGAGLCSVCASLCHEGHELVYMGSMITACACAMRVVGNCTCASPVAESEQVKLRESTPRVAQWFCNRCTVVNAATVRECTVCANTAPASAVLGLNAVETSPESTSRALVPVQPAESAPTAPPSEWSCPACTFLNSGGVTKCGICDSVRPEAKTANDGLLTLYDALESQRDQSAPPVAAPSTSSWFCSACTMENKPADTSCFVCQTARAVPVANPIASNSAAVVDTVSTAEAIPMAMAAPMEIDMVPEVSGHARVNPNVKAADQLAQFYLRRATEDNVMTDEGAQTPRLSPIWDSTAGPLSMSIKGRAYIAQYVEGEYAEKDGYVRGLGKLSREGRVQWRLDGRFKKLSQSQENAFSLVWDENMSRFRGKWFRGDGSGEWKCLAAPFVNDFRGLAPVDATQADSGLQPFYSGLINMKQNLTNVCYQNSFLQSLFLTQAFRRLILTSKVEDYVHLPGESGSGSQGDVLKSVQELFTRLIASQRPELDSHILQRCLPPTFQAGRQQDTSDFAHFLIDSLSQQLGQHSSTAHGIDNVFGGTQATVLACKTCGKMSVNREYFWEMLLNMIDLRYTPITSITAVSGISTEISTPPGYERINSDLNRDRSGVPYVYLCVKRRPEACGEIVTEAETELPITDLVIKVVGFADVKPVLDGYERVELDLNIGGGTVVVGGKKQVYLFFRRELNGSPITDLQLIYGNETVPDGFKQIRVDINQGDGTKIFLCYRCDMPITDMKIVNSGIPGYRMVDHVLNRSNEDSIKQYLAFKVGGSEPCITGLRLVPAAEQASYNAQGWEALGSPSSTIQEGSTPEVLMIRRGHGNPIFAVDVFRAPRQVPRYNDYEVIDLYEAQSLADVKAPIAVGASLKGDWLADEAVDRGRKAVRIHSVSDPITEAFVIKGAFEDKGEVNAVATSTSSAWPSASTPDHPLAAPSRVLRMTGYWKSSKTKQAQLFDVELRPEVGDLSDKYALSGTIGDGRGRPIAVTGTHTSQSVRIKWPISQIFVLRGDERVPEGAEVVRETCSGKTGNVLAQTQSPHTLYLAVKREESPSEGFVGDVCVIYGEIDVVPDHYTCVEATPSGHSANLNDGTSGVPIFICYRRVAAATEKCLMDLALMWTSGAQTDSLPAGFTKIQHTPLGMEANLNQGTTGVSIHLCFAKADPSEVIRPVEDPLNGEYEIVVAAGANATTPAPPLFGKFIRLAVAERLELAHTVEGKFGTVFHGYQPGMVRGTLYYSSQRKKQVLTGVWMSDDQNASSMIDFVPPSFPFEWTLNDATNELDGWWSGVDDASSISYITSSAPTAAASSTSTASATPASVKSWKLMKDAYVRIAFKKDYGTEWKNGRLLSSERVWRHDVASMLSRFVASRTLGGDNLLSCSQCERKTESRTNTVVVAPPAHLILTIKRMFYDWAQQKTRKSLHDVTFPALLTLPPLTAEDELAVYTKDASSELKSKHRQRQYGLYGVLVHSGLTANSGHYFSYCRESDDSTRQLHQEDSPLAPWIKFNDSRVKKSSWAEINSAVSNSVSDTVYLLLYKRLSYEIPQEVDSTADLEDATAMEVVQTADEDEAMLLAKAMALSMSAASQKKAQEESVSKEEQEQTLESTDLSVETDPIAARPIDSVVVKEVEAANTQFLWDMMHGAASAVHVRDLHATIALRHGLMSAGEGE